MAAGLAVRPDMMPELRAFLADYLRSEQAIAAASDAVEVDALLSVSGANRPLYEDFQRLAPFGPGNPEPVFALSGVRAEQVMNLKGGHVRCILVDETGAKVRAVAWRSAETAVGKRLIEGGSSLNAVGKLRPDDWQGRNGVEFEIEDIADPRRLS